MNIYYDNKVAINLSSKHVLHDRPKYVETDRDFIKKNIDSRELVLYYVKTHDEDDIFVKRLSTVSLKRMWVSWVCLTYILNLKDNVK